MNNNSVDIMAKPIGPICNLSCEYCFYLEKEKLYSRTSQWAMQHDVLESFIKQFIQENDNTVINFAWQGGEPTLLGVDYFREIVALQKQYGEGKYIRNAFQTNGVLLNNEWAEFFLENDFLVGVSIDGPEEIHDSYRRDKEGNSTFLRVLHGIRELKDNGVSFNTLTTVHHANEKFPLAIYEFLKEIGSTVMQFIPIVERKSNFSVSHHAPLFSPNLSDASPVTAWSVDPRAYGTFLCAIFDVWIRRDVGKYFIQLFDTTLAMWAGLPADLCVFQKRCGKSAIIEHNGDVYSCDHYVYPNYYLGNIRDISLADVVTSKQQLAFGAMKETQLPQYCRNCDVGFACHGACPKHRFMLTPKGEAGLNYLCAAYRKFFHHAAPYMQFMVKELAENRAPANVMDWANRF